VALDDVARVQQRLGDVVGRLFVHWRPRLVEAAVG
jgi:hypothetical protein